MLGERAGRSPSEDLALERARSADLGGSLRREFDERIEMTQRELADTITTDAVARFKIYIDTITAST
jgi:hypothetical protein